jgi:hypothetical protein
MTPEERSVDDIRKVTAMPLQIRRGKAHGYETFYLGLDKERCTAFMSEAAVYSPQLNIVPEDWEDSPVSDEVVQMGGQLLLEIFEELCAIPRIRKLIKPEALNLIFEKRRLRIECNKLDNVAVSDDYWKDEREDEL